MVMAHLMHSLYSTLMKSECIVITPYLPCDCRLLTGYSLFSAFFNKCQRFKWQSWKSSINKVSISLHVLMWVMSPVSSLESYDKDVVIMNHLIHFDHYLVGFNSLRALQPAFFSMIDSRGCNVITVSISIYWSCSIWWSLQYLLRIRAKSGWFPRGSTWKWRTK